MSSTKYNISRSGASLMVREQSAGDGIFLFPFSASRIAIDESIGLFKVSYLGSRVEAYIGDILSHGNIQDLSDDIALWSQQSAGLTQEEVENIVNAAIQQSSDANIVLSSGKSIKLYNTPDKTTNYERFSVEWSGQTLNMTNQKGGSGQSRPIFVHVNTAGLYISDASVSSGGIRVVTNPISGNGALFGVIGVLNGAGSTQQDGLVIAPYINQSASARANVIKVSPFIGTVGAGVNLLNLGTNTGADNTGTHTPRFVVASNGNVGFGTDSPTHTITLPSGASWTSYNTTDQTTNFERVRAGWSGNQYIFATESSGGGLGRDLVFSSPTIIYFLQSGGIKGSINNLGGGVNLGGNFSGAGSGIVNSSILSANTGIIQNSISALPTINQSGTAGYTGLWISPFEQTTGSGSKLLLDLGTNSAANGSGTHTSRFRVESNGNVTVTNINASADGVGDIGISNAFNNVRAQSVNILNIRERYPNSNITFQSSSTGILGRMFSNGNFFLGSSPVDAGFKLDVNGTARVSGVLNITTYSVHSNTTTSADLQLIGQDAYNTGIIFRNAGVVNRTIMVGYASGVANFFLDPQNGMTLGGGSNTQSSILTLTSTTRGFLPPRMTQAQRTAISSPAIGLMVYQTDGGAAEGTWTYKSTGWVQGV